MNDSAAGLEAETLHIVCPGRLTIGSTIVTDQHAQLLIVLPDPTPGPSARCGDMIFKKKRIEIWPICNTQRLTNGFCKVDLSGHGILLRGLSREDFLSIFHEHGVTQSLSFNKPETDGLIIKRYSPPILPLQFFYLQKKYTEDGLSIEINGRFANAESELPDVGRLRGEAFHFHADIPWRILSLRRLVTSGAVYSYGYMSTARSESNPFERGRDPDNLDDLFLSEDGKTAFVEGSIVLRPKAQEFDLPRTIAGNTFVSVDREAFEKDRIYARNVQFLSSSKNGSTHCRLSELSLQISCCGRQFLGQALGDGSAVRRIDGSYLGAIRYRTGYGEDIGDPAGSIDQKIGSISVAAQVVSSGLAIAIRGDLLKLDQSRLDYDRKHRRVTQNLRSFRCVRFDVVLPWSLLRVWEWHNVWRLVAPREPRPSAKLSHRAGAYLRNVRKLRLS